MTAAPYAQKVYYSLALDPIHIGMGGYRLGEVDMTIVREPGTRLPKIPGSSLEGASRAYTAMRAQNYRRPANLKPTYDTDTGQIQPPAAEIKPEGFKSCAGKGGNDGSDHCGDINCPVCVTYGFTIGPQNRSFHGMAQFYDAQILFFPVHSMVGPVWVTAASALAATGYKVPEGWTVEGDQIRAVEGLVAHKPPRRWGLNLGWLFLEIADDKQFLNTAALWQGLKLPAGLEALQNRLVLLPEKLFSLVVNSNLEVRTSVSIDPATGAAEGKALFTYEAMPRGTVLQFPVAYHNPQHYVFPTWHEGDRKVEPKQFPESRTAIWVQTQVEKGLGLMEYLGVGGMNTRGFGRFKVLNRNAEGGK